MPSKIRLNRIAERIRQELSDMLLTQVQDPRVSGVMVTDVKVDRELAYADIYVSAVEGHERSKEVLDGLHSAAGFLRRLLADRVDLRVFPRLRFHWDPTPERADQIERVLASLRNQETTSTNAEKPVEDETTVEEVPTDSAEVAQDDFSAARDINAADDLPDKGAGKHDQ